MLNLQVEHMIKQGGIPYYQEMAELKSSILYDVIDRSDGFFYNHVHPENRSRINVTMTFDDLDLEK